MMKKIFAGLPVLIAVFIFAGCGKSDDMVTNPVVVQPTDTTSTPIPSPAKENFESGNKDDYSTSTITLSTGKWSF